MKKEIQNSGGLKNLMSEEYRISENDLEMAAGGRQSSKKKSKKQETEKFKEKRKDQGDSVRGFLRFLIGD